MSGEARFTETNSGETEEELVCNGRAISTGMMKGRSRGELRGCLWDTKNALNATELYHKMATFMYILQQFKHF